MGVKPKGPATIDAFITAFNNRRKEVDVPEIGIKLYFPPLTTASQIAVAERMGQKPESMTELAWRYRRNALLFIHQAQLEDGSRAFEYGHLEHLLQSVDFLLLERLVTEMYAAGMPDAPQTVDEGKAGSAQTAD